MPGQKGFAASHTEPTLDPQKAITQYMHDVWQIEEGLPQNTVQAILQTSDGYLWLGTEEGVVRFNGATFEIFDRTNTPVFDASNTIQTLFEDSRQTLWMGTNNGLVAYQAGVFTRYGVENGLAGTSVSAITEDASGVLWVGTADAGLYSCELLLCTSFSPYEKLSEEKILTLLHTPNDVLWIGTEQGLISVADSNATQPYIHPALVDERVISLYISPSNTLWIGTQSGLYQKKEHAVAPHASTHPALQDGVWAIWEDASGGLWLGMSQNGLIRLRGESVELFAEGDPLSNGRIPALYQDKEGSLWIGTDVAGLHRLRDGFFSSITEKEGLSNNIVQSVFESADRSLWIGTEQGLNKTKGGQLVQYTKEDGLTDDFVTSIAETKSNNIWIGTLDGGLNNIRGNSITAFTVQDGLASNAIFSLYVDSQNTLWIGTDQGLSKRTGDQFTNYSAEHGLPSNFITAILEDHSNQLWIGTYDAGLVRQSGDSSFVTFATKEELNSDLVLALHEDDNGVLWIGTYGGGLSRIKDGMITNYTTKEGLFDNVVFQILEDDDENLWMGCNKGVFRVAKSDFDAFDDNQIPRLTSISYDKRHGLKSREFTGGTQPAGWKGQDGKLWFPTIQGVASVDPADLNKDPIQSPVVIEQIFVEHDPLTANEQRASTLVLEPGTERIAFSYAALTFVSPEKVNYRYRLEGYESDWSDVVSYTHASYTHLDPGTYTFRVIAQNSEGIWNEQGASVMFELRPYFYQSPYFWVILIFGAGLLGITGYRWRISQLTGQQKRLELAVTERTLDLTKAKEQIESQAEKLRNSLQEKEVLLREVHHRVKNNLQVITSLLNLQSFRVQDPDTKSLFKECHDRINSMTMIHERLYQSDDLAEIDLSSYLENISVDLARSYNADRRKIRVNVNVEDVRLGLDQAIPSGLIVNELVSNALKHAFTDQNSGEIAIEFSKSESTYTLSVTDNGKGLPEFFDVSQSPSLGMKLVHALTQKLKGTLTVQNRNLTRIQIAFPQV